MLSISMPSTYACLQVRSQGTDAKLGRNGPRVVFAEVIPMPAEEPTTAVFRRVRVVPIARRWGLKIPPRKITVAHGAPPSPFTGLPRVAKVVMEQVQVGMTRGAEIRPVLAAGADLPGAGAQGARRNAACAPQMPR